MNLGDQCAACFLFISVLLNKNLFWCSVSGVKSALRETGRRKAAACLATVEEVTAESQPWVLCFALSALTLLEFALVPNLFGGQIQGKCVVA